MTSVELDGSGNSKSIFIQVSGGLAARAEGLPRRNMFETESKLPLRWRKC